MIPYDDHIITLYTSVHVARGTPSTCHAIYNAWVVGFEAHHDLPLYSGCSVMAIPCMYESCYGMKHEA